MLRAGKSWIVIFAAILLPGPARADDPDYWEMIATPELARYRRELRMGIDQYDTAESDLSRAIPSRREYDLHGALGHFERAASLLPDRIDALYWVGTARYSLGDDAGALEAYGRVRRIDPNSPYEADIAFKLGVAYTRMERFEEGIAHYDRALSLAIDGTSRSITISNKAENLMSLGRLTEAVAQYEAAFEADDRNVLALWGLACALDRDDQVEPARRAAARALSMDPALQGLNDPGVFFVPDHERHYYMGLAREAQGVASSARAEWQAFVQAAGPDGMWRRQAARHLEPAAGSRRPRSRSSTPAVIRRPD